jgi:hypothetical protein
MLRRKLPLAEKHLKRKRPQRSHRFSPISNFKRAVSIT